MANRSKCDCAAILFRVASSIPVYPDFMDGKEIMAIIREMNPATKQNVGNYFPVEMRLIEETGYLFSWPDDETKQQWIDEHKPVKKKRKRKASK